MKFNESGTFSGKLYNEKRCITCVFLSISSSYKKVKNMGLYDRIHILGEITLQ